MNATAAGTAPNPDHGTSPPSAPARPLPGRRAQALWARLRAHDATLGEVPPDLDDLPWYLAALLGVSAWIAAGFLYGFALQLLGALEDEAGPNAVLGVFACATGLALIRLRRGRVFAEQFGIACSLVGQLLVGFAVYVALRESLSGWRAEPHSLAALGLAALSVAMAVLGPAPLHRFLCGGLTAVAMTVAFYAAELPLLEFALPPLLAIIMLWLWLRIARPGAAGAGAERALPPAAWAFSLVALCMVWIGIESPGWGWRDTAYADAKQAAQWLAALAVVALLPVCVAHLTRGSALRWRLVGAAAVLALLLAGAPGVVVGLMLALIGFALHRPALLGLGLLGMAVYLVRYYFQLDVTLLQKSGWLLASGTALLLARLAWRRTAVEGSA